MALFIEPSGESSPFTLPPDGDVVAVQRALGGHVQMMPVASAVASFALVNEDAKMIGHKVNTHASTLVGAALYGPVLLCDRGEIRQWRRYREPVHPLDRQPPARAHAACVVLSI